MSFRTVTFASCFIAAVTLHAQGSAPQKTYTVSPSEFVAVDADITMVGDVARYPTGQRVSRRVVAPVHLPDGAVVTGYELSFCNDPRFTGAFLSTSLHELCDRETPCYVNQFGDSVVAYDGVTCGHSATAMHVRPPADNATKIYRVEGTFAGPEGAVALLAFRIFYRMPVAPAPAVATFSDVPTDHLFFREIEAMARSGVTRGCDAARYCPDEPITRAQAAALLSRALGLGWTLP